MKFPCLYFLLLFTACSMQPKVNEVIKAKFTNQEISEKDMLSAKTEIEKRLGNIKAMNSKVNLDSQKRMLTFQSANKEDQEQSRKFQSLFKKSKFEVRSTISEKRSDIRRLADSLPEIEGFKYTRHTDYSKGSSVLGYVHGQQYQASVLKKLNEHFSSIKDLEIMVLRSFSHRDDKNEGVYQLQLVNMSPSETHIIQSYLTGATSFINELDARKQIKISLNHRGAKNLAELSTNATRNNNSTLALLFNGKVLSAPRVQSPIMTGILTIAYNAEEEEIDELADILSMGPFNFEMDLVK